METAGPARLILGSDPPFRGPVSRATADIEAAALSRDGRQAIRWGTVGGSAHDRKGKHAMSTMNAGGIRITAISDGDSRLPALFYPGLDFACHPELLAHLRRREHAAFTRFAGIGVDWHAPEGDRDRKIRAYLRQIRALGLDVTITPAA